MLVQTHAYLPGTLSKKYTQQIKLQHRGSIRTVWAQSQGLPRSRVPMVNAGDRFSGLQHSGLGCPHRNWSIPEYGALYDISYASSPWKVCISEGADLISKRYLHADVI